MQMAAVLHFRGDAVLCCESAAVVWGFGERDPEMVSVALAGRNARALDGVRIHRVRSLDRRDVRLRHGIPVRSPALTLVDLAAVLSASELEAALAIATRRNLTRTAQIREALRRVPANSRGIGTLRDLVDSRTAPADTRSHYERRLLALIAAAELPRPVTNASVEGHLVDLYWPRQRLVVEIDGFAHHGDRGAFERDRLRDQRLMAAGHRVMRVTARHIDRTPYAAVARLSAALAFKE